MNRKCPNCGNPLKENHDRQWEPFCSERCQLIDLGDWLNGNKIITDNNPIEDKSDIDNLIH